MFLGNAYYLLPGIASYLEFGRTKIKKKIIVSFIHDDILDIRNRIEISEMMSRSLKLKIIIVEYYSDLNFSSDFSRI